MGFTPLRNIVVQQGETFSEVLILKDQLFVYGDYLPSAGDTTLALRTGLLESYPPGTELTIFEWPKAGSEYPPLDQVQRSWTVRTVGTAAANSRALVVDSLPVELKDNDVIGGMAIDLTGWQHRGQIRRQGDTTESPIPAPLASFTFVVSASTGTIEYRLGDTATASLPANCTPVEISYFTKSATKISTTAKQRLWQKLVKAAYVFDIEMFNNTSVFRNIQGYCFVPGEVTL